MKPRAGPDRSARSGLTNRTTLRSAPQVGTDTWPGYCATFLGVPSEAMDELIEGVRILKGRGDAHGQISEDDARRAHADRAREQAATMRQGTRTDLQPSANGTKSKERGSNSITHLLRRVARTSPETLAAYEAGRHTSARDAALATFPARESGGL